MDKENEKRLKVIQGPTIPESHKRSLFDLPDVIKDISSTEENNYDNLSETDRERIQRAKSGGLPITGRQMSNIKDTIDTLVKEDKAMNDLYMRNFFNYLKSRNIDTQMVMADKNTLNRYMKEYDVSVRPSLHNVIDMLLIEVKDILLKNITDTLQQTSMDEENQSEVIELIKNNTTVRREFIARYSMPTSKIIKIEDFIFLEWFFEKYGLSDKDQIFFQPNSRLSDFFDQDFVEYNASGNASGNVDFDEYKEKFLLETGYDFHEVYLHYAQRYKEKFDQDNIPKNIEAPTGLSNSPEYFVPSNRALPKPEPDIITPSYNDDDVIFD